MPRIRKRGEPETVARTLKEARGRLRDKQDELVETLILKAMEGEEMSEEDLQSVALTSRALTLWDSALKGLLDELVWFKTGERPDGIPQTRTTSLIRRLADIHDCAKAGESVFRTLGTMVRGDEEEKAETERSEVLEKIRRTFADSETKSEH